MNQRYNRSPASLDYMNSQAMGNQRMLDLMNRSKAQADAFNPDAPALGTVGLDQLPLKGPRTQMDPQVMAQVQAMRALAQRGRMHRNPGGGTPALPKDQRDMLILMQLLGQRGMGPRRRRR